MRLTAYIFFIYIDYIKNKIYSKIIFSKINGN